MQIKNLTKTTFCIVGLLELQAGEEVTLPAEAMADQRLRGAIKNGLLAATKTQVVEPEAVEPEVVEPEAVEPEAVEPEAVEPEVVEPVKKGKKG